VIENQNLLKLLHHLFLNQSYADSAVVNTATKKSEQLGDYAYVNQTNAELNGGGATVGSGSLSLKLSYYSVLDRYKNYYI